MERVPTEEGAMKNYHEVDKLHFEKNELVLTIDGEIRKYPLENLSSKLLNATEKDRDMYKISPSGYGIHWPTLDEDISIDGLLGIVHKGQHKKQVA